MSIINPVVDDDMCVQLCNNSKEQCMDFDNLKEADIMSSKTTTYINSSSKTSKWKKLD